MPLIEIARKIWLNMCTLLVVPQVGMAEIPGWMEERMRIRIRTKLLGGLTAMVGVLSVVSLLSYYGLRSALASSEVLEEELHKLEVVSNAQVLFSKILVPPKDYLTHAKDSGQSGREMLRYVRLSEEIVRALKQLDRFDTEMLHLANMRPASNGEKPTNRQIVTQVRESFRKIDGIARTIMEGRLTSVAQGEDMIATMNQLASAAVERLEALKRANRPVVWWAAEERARGRSIATHTFVTTLAIVLIGGILGIYFSVSVLRPLEKLREGTRRIASGEFEVRLDTQTNDEIADLAGDFNGMAGELQAFYASMERKVIERTRKLRERSSLLRDERQKLKSIINAMTEGVIFVQVDGMIAVCNGAAAGIWHVRANNLLGRHFAEQLPPEVRPVVTSLLGDRNGSRPLVQQQQPHPDRLDNLSVVRGAGGQLLGVLIVSEDMTERNRLERERQELRRQIHQQDKLSLIGQLAANMAHELNTPLGAILLQAEAIEEQAPTENSTASAREIVALAKRCRTIITDLLTFARKTSEKPRQLDLNEILRNSLGFLKGDFTGKGIGLRVTLDGTLRVIADENRIQQVFLNLLGNAIDGCDKGDIVQVETEDRDAAVVVHIRDNGRGIPADALSRIFEPFYTTKPAGKGTGLGLPICRQILEDYRGTIAVESQLAAGSTFTIVLPGEAP